ncbi:MAG: dihydrodipicolinate reductase [Candidatus Protochlamydia sp.]|nr:dihydrodipicolinate reductase [Candidatus Protochlamydia sp.]
MKIGLFGYGKMGKLTAQMAQTRGHEIAIIANGSNRLEKIPDEIDVMIDFSSGISVMEHIRLCVQAEKALIIGTTGWEEQLPKARGMIENSSIACLYAPNFSIGVYLFSQIVSFAAELINPFEQYDMSGIEFHHKAKIDSPSGTAKMLREEILKKIPRLKDFQFSSVRCGSIPGTHTLCMDCPADIITLTHEARNRNGFAEGAVLAAEWIIDKKGFFSLNDMLK